MTEPTAIRRVRVELLNDAGVAVVTVPSAGELKTPCFNYHTRWNQVWGDLALEAVRRRYGCTTSYPPDERPGTVVSLL